MSFLINPYILGAAIDALGGEITYIVDNGVTYAVHTMKVSDQFRVIRGAGQVEYLVVAGGGSGGVGNGTSYEAGGGGAGGVLTGTTSVSPQMYLCTVGAGGVANGTVGANGSNSSAFGVTAIGGGRGATGSAGTGGNGGSGGGGAHSITAAGTGTAGQGYAGETPPGTSRGGGGGGAGEAGGTDGVGSGGDGIVVSINGSPQYYGGGGAAYSAAGGILGTPGLGGGGTSTSTVNGAVGNAIANTGGGGGAGYGSASNGGTGGSGVVIIRYPISETTMSLGSGGTTMRIYNDGTNVWLIHRFTASSTLSTFTRLSGYQADIEYLVVGGGGQGGSTIGGGGGGGGVLYGGAGSEIWLPVGDKATYTAAGGTGGPAGEGAGGDGQASYLTIRRNLILNPNLETDATNWTPDTGFSFARSTAQAWQGTASLLLTATSDTAGNNGGNQSTRTAVVPGQAYTWSFYARRGTGSRNARAKLNFADASSGGNIILSVLSDYVTLSSSAWTRVSLSVTVPFGATWVATNFDVSAGAVNDTVYFDGLMFEDSPVLGTYFDGSTPADASPPYERYWWSGTVNASTSSEGIYALGGSGGNKGNTFSGGSGGGGGRNSGTASLGTANQGYDGSAGAANDNVAGAGGGASAVGGASTLTVGGNGGLGRTISIQGTAGSYGGGGGAGVRTGNTRGTGSTGGGAGGDGTTAASSGAVNSGGGGGGAGYNGTYLAGGTGGTGNVHVRYKANDLLPAISTPTSAGISNYYDFANKACYNPHGPATTTVKSLGWTATTDGTLVGSPTWAPDYGGVMIFNGTSQRMDVGASTTNVISSGTATRSYHGWMVGNGTIFGSNASAAGQSHIYVTLNGTTLTFNPTYYGGSAGDGPDSFTVSPHASGINFISLVKTASATLWDLYFNGAVVATGLVRASTASSSQALGSPYSGAFLPLTVAMYWTNQQAQNSAGVLSDYNATKARYGH